MGQQDAKITPFRCSKVAHFQSKNWIEEVIIYVHPIFDATLLCVFELEMSHVGRQDQFSFGKKWMLVRICAADAKISAFKLCIPQLSTDMCGRFWVNNGFIICTSSNHSFISIGSIHLFGLVLYATPGIFIEGRPVEYNCSETRNGIGFAR